MGPTIVYKSKQGYKMKHQYIMGDLLGEGAQGKVGGSAVGGSALGGSAVRVAARCGWHRSAGGSEVGGSAVRVAA